MKQWIIIGLSILALSGCGDQKGAFYETVVSSHDLNRSVEIFLNILKKKKLTHTVTIDHTVNAETVHMRLKPETVVLFDDPKTGTQLMTCNPSMGLDLPLRMLFTTDYEGKTEISYTNPEYWTLKHNIKEKRCLAIIEHLHLLLQDLAKETAGKAQ